MDNPEIYVGYMRKIRFIKKEDSLFLLSDNEITKPLIRKKTDTPKAPKSIPHSSTFSNMFETTCTFTSSGYSHENAVCNLYGCSQYKHTR